ncbi:MAG TPA: acyl-CoA dehydrogenase family protein [Actinomycetospora sp.]|jgi:alkylation response protein AidB-like acyl-CoA dehydrogenase|uniref:acyl-CoA dehydrogenase family protein n=1 Tax=Actinomycetospora sp. TaxID=1872135 RepID=UPI002F417CBF
MRWELSEEQADYRTVLGEWLGERCDAETLRAWLDAGDHATFEDRFVGEGWFAVGSSEELGGEGGGLIELAITAEELGRRAAPSSAWLGSMLALPALAAAPEAAKALLADGTTTVLACSADAIVGPAAGVTLAEDGLSGRIPTVLGAGRARRLVVPASSEHGTSLVLLDVDQDGVEIRDRPLTDRSRVASDVLLDRAQGTVLGGDASEALADAALRSAVLVAADGLGVMERMLDMTVEYAGQRHQFGVPIGSFQAVKHAAAEMLVKVEAARSLVFLAAAMVEAGRQEAPLHAAAAKAQVTAAASAAADSALTLHGAIGYTWEHELQIFYKRAKLDAPLFGSPAAWNERLADSLDLVGGPTEP